jgi:hypothetical protein
MPDATISKLFLDRVRKRFESLKRMCEGAFKQVADEDFEWAANPECNSLRVQIQHLRGNLISRWTDPLTTDGEKPDRHRDTEFIVKDAATRDELMRQWEEGWKPLFQSLDSFKPEDLEKTIYIRGEAYTLVDALNRSLLHAAYHTGQIVQIAKERVGERWQSLSIPRGKSAEFNASARGGASAPGRESAHGRESARRGEPAR